jgi:hypothetical protein
MIEVLAGRLQRREDDFAEIGAGVVVFDRASEVSHFLFLALGSSVIAGFELFIMIAQPKFG